MLLSDRDIRAALQEGRISLDPDDGVEDRIGPASIDLRLGSAFLVFERSKQPYIDPRDPATITGALRRLELEPGERFIVHPQELVLATTLESLRLAPDLVGRLEGRSSLGRLGLIVHSTASLFHPGWKGPATMELGNLGVMPVALYPGMRICAFSFQPLTSPADRPYGSGANDKYAGDQGDLTSRIWEEADEW